MSFNLDFALLYAYTLGLFAYLLLWLTPKLLRAAFAPIPAAHPAEREEGLAQEPSAQTRLDAFTRL